MLGSAAVNNRDHDTGIWDSISKMASLDTFSRAPSFLRTSELELCISTISLINIDLLGADFEQSTVR